MELRSTHHSVRRHTPVCSHPFSQINVGCNRGRAETREEEERLHSHVFPATTQCQASHAWRHICRLALFALSAKLLGP